MNYIEKSELSAAVLESQQLSCVTDEFGEMIYRMADHFVQGKSYNKYPKALKEDLMMAGIHKVMRFWTKIDPYRNPFGYITRALYCGFLDELGKHYKHINLQRNLIDKIISENDPNMPQIKSLIEMRKENRYDSKGKPINEDY